MPSDTVTEDINSRPRLSWANWSWSLAAAPPGTTWPRLRGKPRPRASVSSATKRPLPSKRRSNSLASRASTLPGFSGALWRLLTLDLVGDPPYRSCVCAWTTRIANPGHETEAPHRPAAKPSLLTMARRGAQRVTRAADGNDHRSKRTAQCKFSAMQSSLDFRFRGAYTHGVSLRYHPDPLVAHKSSPRIAFVKSLFRHRSTWTENPVAFG